MLVCGVYSIIVADIAIAGAVAIGVVAVCRCLAVIASDIADVRATRRDSMLPTLCGCAVTISAACVAALLELKFGAWVAATSCL